MHSTVVFILLVVVAHGGSNWMLKVNGEYPYYDTAASFEYPNLGDAENSVAEEEPKEDREEMNWKEFDEENGFNGGGMNALYENKEKEAPPVMASAKREPQAASETKASAVEADRGLALNKVGIKPVVIDEVTVKDIANLTRNTKLTIIASLCSVVAVFVLLVGVVCYVRFNKFVPHSTVEKLKEKISTLRCKGGESRASEPHFNNADAERAEEESEDDENEEADFTVYECEGPASTASGQMEIRNPMFHSKAQQGADN